MNMKTDLLENIRFQFKKLMSLSETITYTTADGKNIIVLGSDIAPGVEVYELDESNNQIPLSNGEITLSDGMKIVVTDNKIESVTAPSAEQAPAEPTMVDMEVAPAPEVESPSDVIEDTDTEVRIKQLEMKVEELYNMLQGNLSKTEEMVKCNFQLSEQVKVLSSQPATGAHKQAKQFTTTKDSERQSIVDNIRNMANQKNTLNIGNL